jgi:hypothetical protein
MKDRRSFMKKGAVLAAGAVAATALGGGLIKGGFNVSQAFSSSTTTLKKDPLSKGDTAILRFLAAAEIVESDLWLQYAELGGVQDNELPGLPTGGNPGYTNALIPLDMDMPQYIHDNTEDEITHMHFINSYLAFKGEAPIDLEKFRTLEGSQATGSTRRKRITNLTELTVDTSWWTRYRSRTVNPDLDPDFAFAQAVPSLSQGKFPAIPRSDADLTPANHLQAIANTAGFHFAFIEQGGSSLYPSLAQRVSSLEVLRILLSIGPTETSHFQTWHDKAGNAPAISDPTTSNPQLSFPSLNSPPFGGQNFQTNLIMPEPVPFLSRKFPAVSIIRPTETRGAATATANAFVTDGLFIGQSSEFFDVWTSLAKEADAAVRGGP